MATTTIGGMTLGNAANLTGAAKFEAEDSAGSSVYYTTATLRTKMFAGGTGYTSADPLVCGTVVASGNITTQSSLVGRNYFAVSVPNNTATTLIALTNVLNSGDVAILTFGSSAASSLGRAVAVIVADRQGGYSVNILSQAVAAYMSLTVSGTNLQLTHTLGSTQTMEGSFVRLSSS
jgi:hypothetical protein